MAESSQKISAPYLSLDVMMQEGGFAKFYEGYKKYASVKGVDAQWIQRCMDPDVVEALVSNHSAAFSKEEAQGDGESDFDFMTRKAADADQIAKAIFQIAAPKSTTDSTSFVTKECRFNARNAQGMSVPLYSSMHRQKFKQRISQLQKDIPEATLVKIYLRCMPEKLQSELKIELKEMDAPTWSKLAEKVHQMCIAVDKAENFRELLGLSKSNGSSPGQNPGNGGRGNGGRGGGKGRGNGKNGNDSHKSRNASSNKSVCNFFSKGLKCRYGDECKFSHESEPEITRGRARQTDPTNSRARQTDSRDRGSANQQNAGQQRSQSAEPRRSERIRNPSPLPKSNWGNGWIASLSTAKSKKARRMLKSLDKLARKAESSDVSESEFDSSSDSDSE